MRFHPSPKFMVVTVAERGEKIPILLDVPVVCTRTEAPAVERTLQGKHPLGIVQARPVQVTERVAITDAVEYAWAEVEQ